MLISHQISRSDFQISRSIQINPDETNRAPPPSILTVGKNGRRMYWSIERSSRRWGADPLIKNDEIKPSVREIIGFKY